MINIYYKVAENFVLTDRIQEVLANDLLPVSPEPDFEAQTGPAAGIDTMFQDNSHPDNSAPREVHPTSLAMQLPPSSIGAPRGHLSLAEEVWRSANSLSLSLSSDIFTQETEMQPNSHTDMVQENLSSFRQETGASSMQMQAPGRWSEINNQAVDQSRGLMTRPADQYRSTWSGAVVNSSSTVSSLEGSSTRTSASPELQQQIHANSSANPRFSADDRTSTSGTFHSQLQVNQVHPGPRNLNQIRRTNSCGDQYEIQKYHTLFEAQEMHQQWRQQLSPASELAASTDATVASELPTNLPAGQNLPFQGWQGNVGSSGSMNTNDPSKRRTVKRSNVELMNQVSKIAGPLLRRESLSALELLKNVHKYQKEAAEISNGLHDFKPVQVLEEPMPAHDVQINRPNPRGQQWTLGVEQASTGGPVHAGHDEAAVNHMLAERRRRTIQKENITALRRLVPIISKADKASTLSDAITYLQFLQNKIQEIEESKEDIDQQCEILEDRCKALKERNQALAEMISKDQPSSVVHLNLVHLKLPSMSSM